MVRTMSGGNYEVSYAAILPLVQKPGRYLGNEFGAVRKDPSAVQVRVALAFPDVYEIAQSHPGLQILYDLLNRRGDVYAERVYAPWPDMEALLRQRHLPLVSLETFTPLREFDIVGFTLQYELTYTNLLAMLDLGQIPLLAAERQQPFPLVIAGGPCAFNPEPLAPFLDAVLLGDGEEAVHEICDVVAAHKHCGDKQELLHALRRIEGIYIPAFFRPKYLPTWGFAGTEPLFSDYSSVSKRIVTDLDKVPSRHTFLVPIVQVAHDRPSIEVMRGCVKGCRFCQAGYTYRPLRERNPQTVIEEALRAAQQTGQEELSLLSLSTGDYSCVNPVLTELMHCLEGTRVAVSLPSTRVEALAPTLLEQIRRVRKTGFTLAPEAGTQRLRDIIQKEYAENELLDAARLIFSLGWRHLKLYFMLGLPGETEDDLRGIAELCGKIRRLAPAGAEIVASVSNFVPKAHTPFQWVRQLSLEEVVQRQECLQRELARKGVAYRYHDARLSVLEGVFSRGDRRLAQTLRRAFELGCRFDGWTDRCRFDLWEQAFRDTGVDVARELRRRLLDEPLPWDHLRAGVSKTFLQRELARAFERSLTPDCSVTRCTYCGVCDFRTVRNVDYHVHGSKAGEHRGEHILHWAAEVVRAGNDSVEWEPRGWKKVHRPDLISAPPAHRAPSPVSGSAASHGQPPQRKQVPSHLGTAEEWIAASGESTLHGWGRQDTVEAAFRLRLRYAKVQRARFIGSVELTNVFYRAVRRASLPIAFTRGHHPLPRISFGPALPFGMESESEFADFYFTERVDPAVVRTRLNLELPPGVVVLGAQPLDVRAPSLGKQISVFRYVADLTAVLRNHGLAWAEDCLKHFASGGFPPQQDPAALTRMKIWREAITDLRLDSDGLVTFQCAVGPRGGVKPRTFLQGVFGLSEDEALRILICKVATLFATGNHGEEGAPHPSSAAFPA